MLSGMNTSFETLASGELESILKKDLRYLMVFLMAGIKPARHMDEIEDLFTASIISKNEFRTLRNALLKHGHWQLDGLGYVSVKKDHIDLGDLTLHEFTNMTIGLLSRVSEDGPCNCENFFVVTDEALKKEFYQSVNKALKTLMQKSAEIQGDRLLAWTHIGLDCGSLDHILPGPLFSQG
jgi:hypothetical protein